MAVILRNDDAEALLLDIRAGRAAEGQCIGDQPGAFLVFPTSIVEAGPTTGQVVYPLSISIEPGTLITAGGQATVRATVQRVSVTGCFSWALAPAEVEPAVYRFHQRGLEVAPPPWASQLPRSQILSPLGRTGLELRQARLGRQAREAERWLLTLTERIARQHCRGPISRAVQCRPAVDDDDLVQRVLQTAARLLVQYASPQRPPCSWLRMLRLDGVRDMRRELTRLDWITPDASAALALAKVAGIGRQSNPEATLSALAEAARRLDRPLPRVGAATLDAALRADATCEGGRLNARPHLFYPNPQTPAGPELPNRGEPAVVAAVARLVSDDENLVTEAAEGDPRAVSRVGKRVVHALTGTCEGGSAARARCWEVFESSGSLLASPSGLEHFAHRAGVEVLTALDDCLRRAAGLAHPSRRGAANPGPIRTGHPPLVPAEVRRPDREQAAVAG